MKETKEAPTAIGKVIKNGREDAKISQSKLSASLGYRNGQFISNVERGICSIPLDKVAKVANVLNLDSDTLKEALVEDYESRVVKALSLPMPSGDTNEQGTNAISI